MGFVNALDFSTDDQRLFTGSNDGKYFKRHVQLATTHAVT